MIIFIFLALLFFQSYDIRQEVYLIPAEMKPSWINIEYDNPKCQPLNGEELKQEFVIPETGYICTSSPSYKRIYQRSLFLIDSEGKRTPLKLRETFGNKLFCLETNHRWTKGNHNAKFLCISSFTEQKTT